MVTRDLPASYAATRASLHAVAEHVLAPARYAATGKIGLRRSPGGFATPPFGATARVLAVNGDQLVIGERSNEIARAPISTIAAAAHFVGVEPGAPAELYHPNTALDLEGQLSVDADAAEVIAMWFELIAMALGSFANRVADDQPSEAQLWPEHFDLALAADRINYGGSPGDDHIDVPYLYVGPFEGPPAKADPFWNQPFGAAIGFDEIASIGDAFEFFRHGRALAHESR